MERVYADLSCGVQIEDVNDLLTIDSKTNAMCIACSSQSPFGSERFNVFIRLSSV